MFYVLRLDVLVYADDVTLISGDVEAMTRRLNDEVSKTLNGVNSQMMNVISGKSPHEEASTATTTFDLLRWIRARRLQ